MINFTKIIKILTQNYRIWKWQRKIENILKQIKLETNISKKEKKNIIGFWKSYRDIDNLKWHLVYKNMIRKNYDIRYFIPEDIFYLDIEPSLNNTSITKAYGDKNSHSKIFEKSIMPEVYLRKIHGRFYDKNYNSVNNKFDLEHVLNSKDCSYIIKPTMGSEGGENVKKFFYTNGMIIIDGIEYKDINILNQIYSGDFLIQETVKQHEVLANIYPYSLNTVRVVTLRLKDKIECISAVIRFGDEKRIVDNKGIACGISEEGSIKTYGTSLDMKSYYRHPFTKVKFGDIQLPNFNALKNFARNLHSKLLYFDMVSWDIAIDENGEFKMIEFNLKGQEINFHQVNNGPLFGELTEDVLDQVYNK